MQKGWALNLNPNANRKPCVPQAGQGACTGLPCQQGCIGREGTSEAVPEAIRQVVGGGCQSGWGWILSVTNAILAGTCLQGDSGWA